MDSLFVLIVFGITVLYTMANRSQTYINNYKVLYYQRIKTWGNPLNPVCEFYNVTSRGNVIN